MCLVLKYHSVKDCQLVDVYAVHIFWLIYIKIFMSCVVSAGMSELALQNVVLFVTKEINHASSFTLYSANCRISNMFKGVAVINDRNDVYQ